MKDKELTIIQEAINNARKHKNQKVSIFIGAFGTTVNIEPIKDETPKWIEDKECGDYICSACGRRSWFRSPYCSFCGEQLKIPTPDKEKTDA